VTYSAAVSTSSSSVSTETPRQAVPSFDHFVTQWMSTVGVSWGRARNSSHVQVRAASTTPSIVNVHRDALVKAALSRAVMAHQRSLEGSKRSGGAWSG
jgi:hypothetical protein